MALTITHEEDKAYIGNDDHLKLSQELSFAELIFHMISEQIPTKEQLKLFELILNLSVDHGPDAPSAKVTIEAAKENKTVSESVAAGITQINDSHGGAIEPCMKLLYETVNDGLNPADVVKKFLAADMRMPGFGHRIYEVDPRAQLIMDQAEKADIGKEFINAAKALEKELQAQKGKILPINIDGAIAAALCGFGWESRLGKPVFIIARTVGLNAHFLNTAELV